MSSIENILGSIKNRPTPQPSQDPQKTTSQNSTNPVNPKSGNPAYGNTGKIKKTTQTLSTGEYKKFTMMVRKDLLQKIKTLNMNNSHEQDKFIPEYVTLEEIISYYFENKKD